jgi:general stress protein YciG
MSQKKTVKKLPAAVELGRRGGLAAAGAGARVRFANMTSEQRQELARKAGRARTKTLTREQRQEIARRAAKARWER